MVKVMTIYDWLELLRAVLYAVGVLVSLWLCIEYSNMGDKPLAGVMGTMSLLYGALLVSVSTRYMGFGQIESRAVITPALMLHVMALVAVARHQQLRRKK